MAMVPYDRDLNWRIYAMNFHGWSIADMAIDDSENSGPTLSDRLQELLQIARKANEIEEKRLPLEEFLAQLQQARNTATAAQENVTKASLMAYGFCFQLLTK